jgi:hypothetical protein
MSWNRLVVLLSIAGLIAGTVITSSLLSPSVLSPSPDGQAALAQQTLFDRFAPGQTVTVKLPADAADALTSDSAEQQRDWLLYATIFDSGIDANRMQQALFDVPPVRSDYLRPVGGYAYGPMRWRRLPDGRVVVLVSGNEAERKAQLGRAADEAICDTDLIAPAFLVFSYDIAPESGTAQLTRGQDVAGARLFSAEYGYRSDKIDSEASLKTFLQSVTRLAAVTVEGGAVIASGRMDDSRPAHLMSVEDVAALWQSQKHVDGVTARREFIRTAVDEFNSRWNERKYRTEEEKEQLHREYESESATLEQLIETTPEGASASGFSLDPAQDFAKLRQLFVALRPMFDEIAGESGGTVSRAEIEAAAAALSDEKSVPFLEIVDKISNSDDPKSALIGELANLAMTKTRYQSARYDGLLQGTEVGMTLFYTDLLAKLWALDFDGSAPSANVVNFVPLLKTPVNSAYVPELNSLPGTRVWFGPDDDGFQKSDRAVRFAPRTTRIYAASSNPLKPGDESQPNAPSARFLGWWHDHYDEVARFEPQYQRLDEIVKWSVAFGYLSAVRSLDSLAYLESSDTSSNHWFPCWVDDHPELRFSKWKDIQFRDKRCSASDRQFPTETMPILESLWYRGRQISGGVSLGSRQEILERPAISKSLPEGLRRSGIDFASSETRVLRTLNKTEYALGEATPRVATTTIKAPPAAKFRTSTTEFRAADVQTRLERDGNVLRTVTRVGDADIATIAFARTGDQISVTLTKRDAARAQELLADLIAGDAPADLSAWTIKRADVATTIPLGKESALVRLNGADHWIKIGREAKTAIDIPAGAAMRAGSSDGKGSWTIAFVGEADAAQALQSGEYVVVKATAAPTEGVVIQASARGPPSNGQAVTAGAVRGTRIGNDIYVRRGDLGGTQADPTALRRLARQIDVDRALAYAEQGRYEEFAAEVVQNPQLYKSELHRMATELDRAIDSSLREGKASNALQLIARRALYGDGVRGGHSIQRAIAAAILEKPGAASRALNEAVLTPQGLNEAFATINAAIARDIPDASRRNLERMADFLDLKRAGPNETLRAVAFEKDGIVDFQAELLNLRSIPAGERKLAAAETYIGPDLPAGSYRYVTDMKSGVDQLAYDPNLVEAWKVESRALALAIPSAIVDTKSSVRYQTALRGGARSAHSSHTRGQPCSQTGEVGANPAEPCKDSVYILRPRAPAAPAVGP